MKTISVIIPTFNSSKFIKKAIDSVLNQTFTDFELIIVDDGSSDNTLDIISKYNDKRIKSIKHKHNMGVSAARNSGIKISNGKYIAFLDHDDEWLPRKLEKQLEVIEKSPEQVGLVYTGYYQIEPNRVRISPFINIANKLEGDLYQELVRGNFIVPSLVLIKKEVFKSVGYFDEKLTGGGEDLDLWLRIAKKYHFAFIKDPLVKKFFHNQNQSISLISNSKIIDIEEFLSNKHRELKNKSYNSWLINNFKDINQLIKYIKQNNISPIIFGAGMRGRATLNWLKQCNIKCKFFVDNDKNKQNSQLDGLKIVSPNYIKDDDILFIASSWWRDIVKQLNKQGIKKTIII